MQFLRSAGAWCVLIGTTAALGLGVEDARAQAGADASASKPDRALEAPKPGVWEHGIGEGFGPEAQTLSFQAGGVAGMDIFGTRDRHDLALLCLSYGHMLGPTRGEGHWWHGNWEVRGELFGGVQFSPQSEWLIGMAPHLRYNLATGSRWVPYLDGGVGVTAVSIGPPDLSNTFEFNLQGGPGVHYFLRDNLALTIDTRFLHISCAGLSHPNLGLNGFLGYLGLTWFF